MRPPTTRRQSSLSVDIAMIITKPVFRIKSGTPSPPPLLLSSIVAKIKAYLPTITTTAQTRPVGLFRCQLEYKKSSWHCCLQRCSKQALFCEDVVFPAPWIQRNISITVMRTTASWVSLLPPDSSSCAWMKRKTNLRGVATSACARLTVSIARRLGIASERESVCWRRYVQ